MAPRGIVSFLTHKAPDGGPSTLAQTLDARVVGGGAELIEPGFEGEAPLHHQERFAV